MNVIADLLGFCWLITQDGDPRVSTIYRRHYSCYNYRDGRRSNPGNRHRRLCVGPGEKLVLISADGRAALAWRKFIDRSGQQGVNCAFFRNEGAFGGAVLSSELILKAEVLAWAKWPGARLYTYVNTRAVRGDGLCFKAAGWRKCGRTKNHLLILEKFPHQPIDSR
ncbi:MAG: hypothetical protein KC418_23545 [Anaerolineales bacterium]|nr:hypothetical protein [Anaerolineales bacterium]